MKTLKQFWPLAGLFVFILWAYAPVFFLEHPLKFDLITTAYPWRYFIGECLQQLYLPLWNPYQNLGYPIHADPQSGAWYPVVWIIGFLRGYDIYSQSWEFLFHLFMAGIGMQMLARRLALSAEAGFIASIAYIGCGFFVGNAQHLPWIISATWIPYILAFYLDMGKDARLRTALLAAMFIFLLLSGGYPAFLIVLIYLLLLLFVYFFSMHFFVRKDRRTAWRFVLANLVMGLSSLLFSAVVLVSVYEALPLISRGAGVNLGTALTGPFSPQSFISFVLPFAVVDDIEMFHTDASMNNAYTGLIILVFFLYVLFMRKPAVLHLLLGWAAFCLLAALGEYLPVRQWLYEHLPLMNLFRMPSLFRLFTIIGIILTGAYGLSQWLSRERDHEEKLRVILLFFFLVPLIIAALFFMTYHNDLTRIIRDDLFHPSSYTTIYDRVVIQGIIQAIFIALLLLTINLVNKRSLLAGVIVLLVFLDVGLSVKLNAPYTVYDETTNSWTLRQFGKSFPEGFPKPMMSPVIFNSDTLSRHQAYFNNVNCFRKQFGWDGYNPFNLGAYDSLVFQHRDLFKSIISNPPVYLSDKDTQLPLHLSNGDTVYFTAFSPNEMTIQTRSQAPAMLSLLQNHYPGWIAVVDGQATGIHTSNLCFMSVYLGPGEHTVIFRYHPKNVLIAAWVSLISLITALSYLLAGTLRRRRIHAGKVGT